MKRIQKWQKSNRREFISTWDAELLDLKASPVLNFQCNLCPVQVTPFFLWEWKNCHQSPEAAGERAWEEALPGSLAQLCHQPSHVALGKTSLPWTAAVGVPSHSNVSGCSSSLTSAWIPAPGPTLLGTVLSRGWSRPRLALISIQVSHPGFHKHCRLRPGFRRMNKSIFTPAPSSRVMNTLQTHLIFARPVMVFFS